MWGALLDKNLPQLHVILPHRHETRVLLLPEAGGWTLPSVQPESWPEYPFPLFVFGMQLQSVLGCVVEALHCPYFARGDQTGEHRFVFALHNRDDAFQAPQGARWLAQDELDGIPLVHEHLRPVLAAWFHEQVTGQFPPERPPWAFAGWREQAVGWIEAQVAAQGWQITGDIEQVRKWCITCVLKVPTTAGDLYFKAVPPTFAREVAVTRYLAEQQPDSIPAVLACDEGRHWLLLGDFGQDILGDGKEITRWEQAVREFTALKVQMVGRVEALLACGALDYRSETLPARLDAMLADETMLRPDRFITAEEIIRVRALAPRIKGLIAELQACDIPSTLIHGDFHIWNVALQNGRAVFFDWTDAAVGSPFFDATTFFWLAEREVFSDSPEVISHLQQLYLQGLAALAPPERLQQAFAAGIMLGLLHQAVNYHHLLRHIEPAERWTLDYMTEFLKELLNRLEAEA